MQYEDPRSKIFFDAMRGASKITIATKCLGCSQEFKKSGTWFIRHKKCPACGADFDPQPFRDAALAASKKVQALLKQKK